MATTTRSACRGRVWFLPALAVMVAWTAACGSTVPVGTSAQQAGAAAGTGGSGQGELATAGDDFGLGAPDLAGERQAAGPEGGDGEVLGSPAGVTDGAQGSAVPGGSGGSPASGASGASPSDGSGDRQGSGGATSGGMPPKGRGYNEKTVYIGFATTEDARESGANAGLDVYTGDQKRQVDALRKDINERGGLLGRKIEIVYHNISSAGFQTNRASAQEAACHTWTQDHTVFAAISGTGNLQYGDSPIYACLAKHDIALFFSDNAPHEGSLYRRYPSHLFTPGVASVDRFGPALVRALADQRYFRRWDTSAGEPGTMPVKVGVLYTSDQPSVPAIFTPALRRAGHPDPEYFEASAESTDKYASDLAAAVLRFRSEGVTHVITNGSLPYFGPAAENQGYRPRYGVGTWDALSVATQTVPAAALNGAMGAGYLPHIDVDAGNAPKDEAANPVIARCLKIMERAGQVPTNRFTVYSMVTLCENFWLLESALRRADRFDTAQMRAAIDTFRKPVQAGVTFTARYGPPAQHDGAAAVRHIGYRAKRSGFVYTSGNRLIGS